MNKTANQYKNVLSKEIGSKIGCFAAFYHHCLAIMSAHMHVYCYPLFENLSNNWYTAGYGKLIVVYYSMWGSNKWCRFEN